MKKSIEILGLPIISITEGRELGISKSLLIDAKNGVVAALTIEDDDWYRGVKLIPYEAIIAIGEDAVTITHSENILNLEEAGDYERLLVENIRVIGTKAITKSGRIQGTVTEVFVGEGGRIEKCEITTPDGTINEVTAEQISIFGKQVTVVDGVAEKKNNLTETPAFEPAFETPAESAISNEELGIGNDLTASDAEVLQATETFETPTEIETPQETSDVPQEDTPPEVDVPVETPAEPLEVDVPVETPDVPPEIIEIPTETSETTPEEQAALEEAMTPEPSPEPAPEAPAEETVEAFTPAAEETPAQEPTLSEEEQKIAAMTQQAEDLKAALQKARASKQPSEPPPEQKLSQKKQVEKAVDERRRRVLLGKHATKTIVSESGTIVVEAGGEVTEDVLQRARLSNKFIELSMNVQ